ncbi:peroxiredoxin [Mariprofundus sp. EBB-1]|uniref:peroxiredoxin family protein n=1 Tax=Mariprofundus sp. EBB-1 TaxID=2650971 RepID=UPI001F394FDE|nr:TlpA disulfide reductase family protein [Mariprofundus sp. EBB-1]
MSDSLSDESLNRETNMASRWFMILALIAGISAAVWMTLPDAPGSMEKGSVASDFQLPDLEQTLHSLPKGEVILLNFWATWCPPCRKEIPSMAALHDKYAPDGLKIIAISVDKRSSDLANFVDEYRMPFQVLHDADGAVSRQYGVFRYPESFLIGRDGKILYHLVGAMEWMDAPVTKTIEAMLSTSSTAETTAEDTTDGVMNAETAH